MRAVPCPALQACCRCWLARGVSAVAVPHLHQVFTVLQAAGPVIHLAPAGRQGIRVTCLTACEQVSLHTAWPFNSVAMHYECDEVWP